MHIFQKTYTILLDLSLSSVLIVGGDWDFRFKTHLLLADMYSSRDVHGSIIGERRFFFEAAKNSGMRV